MNSQRESCERLGDARYPEETGTENDFTAGF